MEKTTMSVQELSSQLGISLPKAYELVKSEGFPSIRIGTRMQKSSENLWNVWRCFSLRESAAERFSDCESSGIVLVNSHRHSFKWTEKRHSRKIRLCRIFQKLQNP